MALFNWKKKATIVNENNESISGKPDKELQFVEVDTTRNIEDISTTRRALRIERKTLQTISKIR